VDAAVLFTFCGPFVCGVPKMEPTDWFAVPVEAPVAFALPKMDPVVPKAGAGLAPFMVAPNAGTADGVDVLAFPVVLLLLFVAVMPPKIPPPAGALFAPNAKGLAVVLLVAVAPNVGTPPPPSGFEA